MTNKPSSGELQRESRRRRRRLLLVLLVALTAITWIFPAASVGLSDFSPKASPTPTVAASASPTASDPAPTASASLAPGTSVSGDGDGTGRLSAADFGISGSGADSLRPGTTTVVRLTLTNPNGVPIYVTSLKIVVSKDPAGCSSQTNLRIVQSNVSGASPITIPARGAITLATAPRAPQITLLNLPDVNQDACKGKAFTLTYSGSAHS
jgi:hypothetical protein